MNFAETFIRRPVATTLLVLTILIFGIMGYFRLPVADLPTIDYPTIQVNANLPGANPDTMASSVATPLEKQFATISGITSISSRSSQGSTSISLTFDLDRDIDAAAQDVQTTIARSLAQPAAGHADAAVVQQEQSDRHAGAVPDADLGHAAAGAGRSLRRDRRWRSACRWSPASRRSTCSARRSTRSASTSIRRSSRRARSASTRSRRRSTARTSTGRPARSSARPATSSCSRAAS